MFRNNVSICLYSAEDAYRIDADVDGEVVGLDILDTAGQVRLQNPGSITYTHTHTHTFYIQ